MFFINNTTLIHPNHPNNGQQVDILIENGNIKQLSTKLKCPSDATRIEGEGTFTSVGYMDIGVQACDPGFEHREDLLSALEAAAVGGFTAIAIQPNTQPVIHSKSEIAYAKNKAAAQLVSLEVIGALSHDCKGEEISEMFDMHHAGAVAFSDGEKSIKHSGIMLRALQYVKAFNGLIMNHPFDKSIAQGGQMHEGIMSTSLGMKGIPSISEEMMLLRDLSLLAYTDSRLHVANISTARSVALIREAKAKGLKVTASVAAINLSFDDSALADFNTFLKVQPPLREASDIIALREGLADGTIDYICSNHTPHDEETKNLEYPYATFGASGLETAFAVSHTFSSLSSMQLVEKWAINPRKILNLPIPTIEVGTVANLTIFDTNTTWNVGKEDIKSKSLNNPFIGQSLKGQVIAIFNNGMSKFFQKKS
jgi:dihydroorotase